MINCNRSQQAEDLAYLGARKQRVAHSSRISSLLLLLPEVCRSVVIELFHEETNKTANIILSPEIFSMDCSSWQHQLTKIRTWKESSAC